MKKWEYKELLTHSGYLIRILNLRVKDGWEVVSIEWPTSTKSQRVRIILKREITEPPAESDPETIVELRTLGEDGKMRIEPPDDLSSPVKIVSPGYADPSLHHLNS